VAPVHNQRGKIVEFEIHSVETAPAGAQAHLGALRDRIGFVPNLAGVFGGAPAAIESLNAQQGALRSTELTAVEREVIGVAVSVANTCPWSVAAHSTFLAGQGGSPELVDALRAGKPVPDQRLEALRQFVLAVVGTGGRGAEGAIAELAAAGFTAGQALEAMTQASFTTLANWVANVADPALDQAFVPMAWA